MWWRSLYRRRRICEWEAVAGVRVGGLRLPRLASRGHHAYGAGADWDLTAMLAFFRRFLGTWAARAFFVVLIASFGLWGVSGVVQDMAVDNSVAQVGTHRIGPDEFQAQYRRALDQVSRMLGGRVQPTPAISRGVAGQTLERMVMEAGVDEQATQLGIVVPPEEVRRAVFDIPAFRGTAGVFDRSRFNQVMRENNLTEARFLEQVRANLAQNQLMEAVTAGAAPPDVLTRAVFDLQRETRVAEYVEVPFGTAPEPPAPTADDLQRQYDNNLPLYSAAEFRRIKAVVLTTDTIARPEEVTDAEIQAYWDAHQSEFVVPERRSVRIIVAPDEAAAAGLATAWTAGASWEDIQKQAGPKASVIPLNDALRSEIPAANLAGAVFGAAPDAVVGPVGTSVFQVVKVTPGRSTTLDAETAAIRLRVARDRAADGIYTRIGLLEDAVAASPTLDEIPADIGAAAVSGSLDAQGNTPEGGPAPIPGTPAQRQAVITAAFALAKGEPPHVAEGPEGSHFAVVVEDLTASAPKPFASVEEQVRADWVRAAQRKSQEAVAAKILTDAQAGSLEDAATVAGLRLQRTPPLTRGAPPPGIPREVADAAFRLRLREPTMIEAPDAFLVLSPAESNVPDIGADPLGAGQIRRQLSEGMGQDLQNLYAGAIRARLRPTVNQRVLDSIVQPPS